jgi:hypothetical protein
MRRRFQWWAVGVAMVCVAVATVLFFSSHPRSSAVSISAKFTWNSAPNRSCDTARPDSVICITGALDVAKFGHLEYVRDAVSVNATTSDGCPEYSAQGTLWVDGGSANLVGKPAPTCGGDDSPDAHYLYTVTGGSGRWANASGHGEILADRGIDTWSGTLSMPGEAGRFSSSGRILGIIFYGVAAFTIVPIIALYVARRRLGLQAENPQESLPGRREPVTHGVSESLPFGESGVE